MNITLLQNATPIAPRRKPRALYLLLLLSLLLPYFASSQVLELSPFVGYRLGGKINTDNPSAGNLLVPNLDIKNTGLYGLHADINISKTIQISVAGDIQSTQLEEDPRDGNPNEKVFDLDVSYLQGGVTIQHPNRPLTGYVSIMAGATFLTPKQNFESTVKGSGSMALGGRFYFAERFGVRLQMRVFSTFIGSDQDLFCDRDDQVCYQFTNSTFMTQLDFTTGLTILLF